MSHTSGQLGYALRQEADRDGVAIATPTQVMAAFSPGNIHPSHEKYMIGPDAPTAEQLDRFASEWGLRYVGASTGLGGGTIHEFKLRDSDEPKG
ncbi:MAG: hypothetical protein O7D97_07925 [Planctomycetota bacterium]|nr:hypothetical protein [Planctomycetota bacterium]MCZ6811916.1 hypothetical protein [Planctomycetota bacterium]